MDNQIESMIEKTPFVVGMALKKEKAKKHLSQKLIDRATQHGILLKVIDEYVPLAEQGHFDVILQKIRRREWEEDLESYAAQHPEVRIHDMPQDTYLLRNRGTMLEPLVGPGWVVDPPSPSNDNDTNTNTSKPIRCSIPPHTTIYAGATLEAARAQLDECGMRFPILAKSLWADGRPSSHAMGVVHSEEGFRQLIEGPAPEELALPLLFEQYINHGTCLFKVYVLGDEAVMVTRPSLHLETEEETEEEEKEPQELANASPRHEAPHLQAIEHPSEGPHSPRGTKSADALPERTIDTTVKGETGVESGGNAPKPALEVVSRVSAYPRCHSWGKYDLAPRGHGVPAPPEWLWRRIASDLRRVLNLTLFNFDLIVPLEPLPRQAGLVAPASPAAEEGLVHLIDINYFPGIEKLPDYEALLVRFFDRLRVQAPAQP